MNQEEEKRERMGNFDEAEDATRVLFEDGPAEEAAPEEDRPEEEAQPEETGPETAPEAGQEQEGEAAADPETAMAEQAVQTAEQAAGLAQEKDAQLQQTMQELQAMKKQNAQLMEAISQMSSVQQEAVMDEALSPPVLDLSRLAYEDDDAIARKQSEYAEQMANYVMQKMNRSMEPLIKQAEQGKTQRERAEAIAALEQVPELAGFRDMLPQIENIIQNNSLLSGDGIPMDERYVTAYAIAKGIDSMNHPKTDPTAEELMQFYESNPEFQELLEKKRLEQVRDKPQIPPLSASSGGVNAALNIAEKPKTFDEAGERTRKMFGL